MKIVNIDLSLFLENRSELSKLFYILGVEVQKSQMNVENKQAHTLFGVIGLFFFGHLFRIVLNINDIYLFSFREVDEATNCDCVVDMPLYTLVSTFYYKHHYSISILLVKGTVYSPKYG